MTNYCYDGPTEEPLEEYVTPTEGPVLPEVEVRDYNDQMWAKAKLVHIDKRCDAPYFVRVARVALWFKQCRTKKESVETMEE
jgi:hypothetical protein